MKAVSQSKLLINKSGDLINTRLLQYFIFVMIVVSLSIICAYSIELLHNLFLGLKSAFF